MVTKTSLRATILQMQAGDAFALPMGTRAYSYIRNCATRLGNQYGRKYSTHADRKENTITITRLF